jgi:hypothetical protein
VRRLGGTRARACAPPRLRLTDNSEAWNLKPENQMLGAMPAAPRRNSQAGYGLIDSTALLLNN